MEEMTMEVLSTKIAEYEGYLEGAKERLGEDPSNVEYANLVRDITEFLKNARELLEAKQGDTISKDSIPDQAFVPVSPSSDSTRAGIANGSRVEAQYTVDSLWYPAVVTSVTADRVGVEYMFYGNSESLPPEHVRIMKTAKPVPVSLLQSGFRCQAKFLRDGLWYDCKIEYVLKEGESYAIIFDQFKDPTSVPYEWLRVKTEKTGELKIPDTLKILPTDSQRDRERKKKGIKVLKSQHRLKKLEEEQLASKTSWKQFQEKSKKRSRVNYKQSIFEVAESVDSKVGVSTSGRAMSTFAKRSRFSFS